MKLLTLGHLKRCMFLIMLSLPIFIGCTVVNIVMAWFFSMKKSSCEMLINLVIVFTFTRQRCSGSTFS
jgi:hypothetical protein